MNKFHDWACISFIIRLTCNPTDTLLVEVGKKDGGKGGNTIKFGSPQKNNDCVLCLNFHCCRWHILLLPPGWNRVQMLNLIKLNYGSLKFFFLLFHSVKCLIKDKFSLLFDSLKLLFYWNISLLINTKLTFMPVCSIKELIQNCNHFTQQMNSACSITLQKKTLFRKRTKKDWQSWLAMDIKPELFLFLYLDMWPMWHLNRKGECKWLSICMFLIQIKREMMLFNWYFGLSHITRDDLGATETVLLQLITGTICCATAFVLSCFKFLFQKCLAWPLCCICQTLEDFSETMSCFQVVLST